MNSTGKIVLLSTLSLAATVITIGFIAGWWGPNAKKKEVVKKIKQNNPSVNENMLLNNYSFEQLQAILDAHNSDPQAFDDLNNISAGVSQMFFRNHTK